MALKSLVLLALLAAAIAVPMAQAQPGGSPRVPRPIFFMQGEVSCISYISIIDDTDTPVFPNAAVQLQCGGNVVSTTTTNGSGQFSILLDPLNFVLSTLLSECRLAVNTPLNTCDARLPSVGGLLSTLQYNGSTLLGRLIVKNIIPTGFNFTANMN